LAVEVALARWLEAVGVMREQSPGPSLGEIAAYMVAGVVDLPTAAKAMEIIESTTQIIRQLLGRWSTSVGHPAGEQSRATMSGRGPCLPGAAVGRPSAG
jgi:acyl transferase domain-containing protein